MEYKGMNLCDFCFEPVGSGPFCPHCGLSHEKYHAEAGLLLPGTNLLGKYIVGRVLGRGGFGATYLAYSSEKDAVVALKEYFPNGIATRAAGEEKISLISDDKRQLFEKGANKLFEEAKTISKFNTNKNVVSVYEFFYANDTVYYSMEYLKGIDLKGYIAKKGGRLSEAETITIMKSICEALVTVHSTQTLHRDISPDNIFICTNGDVKLIDFGAAKQVIGGTQQVYSVVVKQGFAPPEQYKSNGRQGVWTDIYAAGASMYYALMGKVPADAMNRVENPEIVFDDGINISPQLQVVIKKCLESRIEDRYQSALELLDALNEVAHQGAAVGGNEYVQAVYNGVSAALTGDAVSFGAAPAAPTMQSGYNPNMQGAPYPHSGFNPNMQGMSYPNSGYPNSGYPNQGFPMGQYGNQKEKSGVLKGVIIGVSALIIVALIVALIVVILSPSPMMGPPPTPPEGGHMGGAMPNQMQ